MKKDEIKRIFNESYDRYVNYIESKISTKGTRIPQCKRFINIFDNINFPFDKLNVVETGTSCNPVDGVFGLIFGFAAEQVDGVMLSVDINKERLNESKKIFNEQTPALDYQIFNEDSVTFLTNLSLVPNLVHLDSWDMDLKNPFPSALHGWREFTAIESKMESESIILIDDNYLNGSWVQWNYTNGTSETININYPIIGKGALVYHYIQSGLSNWNLVGDYPIGDNIKIMLQKK
jgi:hypothetical protein